MSAPICEPLPASAPARARASTRGAAAELLARSWARCRDEYGLERAHAGSPGCVDAVELERRLVRCAELVAGAERELRSLREGLADLDGAVLLADADGVIVHLAASAGFAAEGRRLGLCLGARWGEGDAGTNAVGSCLVAERPMAIHGEDHYAHGYAHLSGAAVPLYASAGGIAGALGVIGSGEWAQTPMLMLLETSASLIACRVIEARLGATRSLPVQGPPAAAGVSKRCRTPPRPRAAVVQPQFADPKLACQLDHARRVIAHRTPVLLCGETGCGKEVFARALHAGSPHAQGGFIAVNCASLPAALIESELFGYRAGAFTGASRSGRSGKVLQADGGTLFLDEIADMPLDLQARLLRVLDERCVTPLGTEESHEVDFQLISASHRSLPALVRDGRFREDLYYRIAGVEFALPALRERADLSSLIATVLVQEGGDRHRFSRDAEQLLLEQPWPGNIRQLRHVVRAAVALSDGPRITREHLLPLINKVTREPPAAVGPARGDDATLSIQLDPIEIAERRVMICLLTEHRWNVSRVAQALGVSRNSAYRKIHKLHIELAYRG
ncbi:MAG: sigma-54-dependent Fis family transcriptional regulator [Burkholderiales bacterium]|nr:sigma-54-dependent Fis family transcriptional regulator [Burkholderiales bacterium]MDE1929118.1 sigma-54-dependent Fis family transcriptional regulator [Burkholderiales bacterium]MDE2157413.1 sigma-54-dependent Fis family transcriptional regulator [Burkholderiales bacterium]MDE2503077.1 sigma-54-dependent Fis family transcriptional regulator [Burkholderiales bacterium]